MDIVVDTSVIIAVIANEPQRDMLIDLTKGADLIAPPSVHWEICNAFSAMLKRGRIALAQALQALAIYRQIPLRFVDIELDTSLSIAAELDLYAYDAYLVQCSLKYGAPLVSLDSGLLQAGQRAGAKVIEVM